MSGLTAVNDYHMSDSSDVNDSLMSESSDVIDSLMSDSSFVNDSCAQSRFGHFCTLVSSDVKDDVILLPPAHSKFFL